MTTTLSVRATLTSLSMSRSRKACFESKSEKDPFTLSFSAEQAQQLLDLLTCELDIVAYVQRDEGGAIKSGWLTELTPVTKGDATAAWKDWYPEMC